MPRHPRNREFKFNNSFDLKTIPRYEYPTNQKRKSGSRRFSMD